MLNPPIDRRHDSTIATDQITVTDERTVTGAAKDTVETVVSTPPRSRRPISDIALIAVFAASIAACSVIAIPIGAVPITLQTFAVLLSGAVLGASRGFLTVMLYLAIGAMGLPVFAGGSAGLAPFAGASAGYLLSFPFAALLTGFLVQMLPRRSSSWFAVTTFGAALISTLLLSYPMGIVGMSVRTGLTISEAFTVNLAFIPFDLAKIALVAIVATSIHRAFPTLFPARRAHRVTVQRLRN